MNRSLWYVGFGALLIAALVLLPLGAASLPDVVATHFSIAGDANGFTTRANYLVMMLLMTVGLPAGLVAVVSLAAAQLSPLLKVPHRAHWFAPARRAGSVAFLRLHMVRFGCLLVVFFGVLHALMIEANRHQPARLPVLPWMVGLVGIFVLAVIAWKVALHRHFHAPG